MQKTDLNMKSVFTHNCTVRPICPI